MYKMSLSSLVQFIPYQYAAISETPFLWGVRHANPFIPSPIVLRVCSLSIPSRFA